MRHDVWAAHEMHSTGTLSSKFNVNGRWGPIHESSPHISQLPHENCWICGQWRPVRAQRPAVHSPRLTVPCSWCQFSFKWRPPRSGPIARRHVLVRLEFDDWHADVMQLDESGTYTVNRMVPYHTFHFQFIVRCVGHALWSLLNYATPLSHDAGGWCATCCNG